MPAISHARPDDATAMRELQQRAFAEEGRRVGSREIPPLTEAVDAIEDHIRHQTALVARDGGRIVGAIRGVVTDRVCVIRALVVDLAYQGQGLGSRLLAALERALPEADRFDLTTNIAMERNVPFYERHGYRVTEITRHSERITLAQMSKPAARQG